MRRRVINNEIELFLEFWDAGVIAEEVDIKEFFDRLLLTLGLYKT